MRRSVRHLATTAGIITLTIVGLLVAWKGAVVVSHAPEYILPAPEVVVARLLRDWRDLGVQSLVTLREILAGFTISLIVGVGTAVGVHASRRLHDLVWPVVLFLQITPQIALAPLLVSWLGIGLGLSVTVITLIAFFPIIVNTYAGLESLPPEMEELGRSMRISRLGFAIRFELPHALPNIAVGARIGMTYAVVGAVIAEFLGSSSGLGYVVVTANGDLDAALMMSALVVLALLGLSLYLVVSFVERVMIPWQVSRRQRDGDVQAAMRLGGGM